MQFRVEAGLLILSITFVVFLFGGLNVRVGLGETWRLIAILEANPHRHLAYIRDAFLYFVLPPAVGLAFSIIAFIRETKSPTGVLEWWLPLTVFGGFFFFWGTLELWLIYSSYSDVLHSATKDISNRILPAYAVVSLGCVLWIFTGVLFMLSPAFKIMIRNKERVVKNREVK